MASIVHRRNPPGRRRKARSQTSDRNARSQLFVELAGRRFDSRLERDRAEQLCMLQRAGEIGDLRFQVTVKLTDAQIGWRLDFAYTEDGRTVYEDAKGWESERWAILKRLWPCYGPGPLRISKRNPRTKRIEITQTIHSREQAKLGQDNAEPEPRRACEP